MPHERLLIAEGSPVTRAEVAAAFTAIDAGSGVVTCAAAAEVVPLARRHRPQVVLVDAALPGLDVAALTVALERNPDTRPSVVVLTCPRDMDEAQVAALEASGALLVLVKPLTRDGLTQAFAQALAESRGRRPKASAQPRRAA